MLSVQVVIRDKSLNVKPNVTDFSMVAIAVQTVNLLHGTSLLVVTVQNVAISSWRKKFVVVASRLYVVMATTKKKRLNNFRVLKVNFRLFLIRT